MDEAQVQRIVEANNAELMRQISTLVSSQVASIKRSADEASTTQIIREIKKIKSADYRPTFNRKSNEEQYKSATRILDTLEEAKFNLEESKDLQATKDSIDKGINLCKERQKLILLADKSKYGWKTVGEYLTRELADNSDDEKKIYRAESRAARNMKRPISRRQEPRAQRFMDTGVSPIPTIISRGSTPSPQPPRSYSQKVSPGACFSCGKLGHWRSSCPFIQRTPSQSAK